MAAGLCLQPFQWADRLCAKAADYLCCADFYMSLYNVIFSVLPPLVIGIFDQDVNREMSRLYAGTF